MGTSTFMILNELRGKWSEMKKECSVRLNICRREPVRPELGRVAAREPESEDRRSGAQRLGDTRLRLLLLGAEHPRAPFSFSGLGDPGFRRPTQPNSASFSPLLPDGSSLGASIPWDAAPFPLPLPKPSVFRESVWDTESFGDPGLRVPPAVAAAPRKGWNKHAFVAEVIISGALMGLETAGAS
ncbi:hypothetical protein mRhiFer1_008435 [Rhinolophus ferrumequinum]|uniref:Uncharacterized protein n=1 Tax=Rhinolophus ferrumequinum TaxID=59479 RepID=A0A7J7V8K6_RHIFE|nr:hypothetical protein mRhiFer1_008435 [Rhinolophus ferrumequinum]